MVERKIIKAQVGDNSQKQFLKNWYSKRKIQDDYLQEALELDKPNILKRLNNFTNYNYIDNLSSGNSGENNITGQFNPNANKVFIKKGINNLSDVKLHELNHYATYNKQGDYITTGHQDIVNNEIKSKQEREGIYKNDYFQDPREIHSRIMVLRKDAGFKPDVPVTQKDLDGYLKKKEVLDKSGKRLYYNLPENVNDIFQNAKSNKSVLNMLNYMAVNDNNKLDNKMQNGGMIKRADGSYSKRGLWDSIRANKGSGKSPTKEMLAQERKINNKQVGGDNELMELFNQFANSVDDDDFQSGEDVYNEYNKLNTIQQKQFLSSIQEQGTSSMQTGGSKYITSNLKDYNKRNKSYNDSLSLYKNGLNLQNQQFKQHKIQTDRFEGSKVTNWKGKEALNSLMKQYKKDKIKPTSVGIYTMNSDAPDNPGYPVYKKPNQKVLYQKPIEQVIQQQEVPQEVLQQIKTSPVLPMKNMVTPLLKYDRGDPRSKNTVDYKITNDGKQWTPEEYDNYIDEQKAKTSNYNKSLREMQTGGIPTNRNGYYELDPEENPIARIPSNSLSMRNIPYDIQAIGGTTGTDYGYMKPEGEYQFDDEEFMYEIPKAQTGSRSPRGLETEEEKKARILKYNLKGGRFNKDFSLTGDMDMVQSRQANVPFLRSNQAASNTQTVPNTQLDEVLDTAPRLRQNTGRNTKSTSKPRYNPAPIRNTATETIDNGRQFISKFNKEYRFAELDAQYSDSLANKPLETVPVETVPFGFVDPAVNRGTTSNNGFIGSRPITIGYDNDAEARAIQYRKLKNSSILAPYRGGMTLESPSLYQESTTPYLDNIREQRNAMLQQVNSNSSTGQALLANMYGQGLNQENQVIGEVARNNAQNTTQYLNQRADINNKQQQFDYNNDNRYYGDVAQLQSNQDEEDINYMNSIANMQGKRLQAKNSLFNTAIMTGLPDEALHIGDEGVTFDVSKIPKGFYDGKSNNRTQSTIPSQQKEKSIMIGGVPHAIEYDDNGKITNYRKIPVAKAQYGTMNKYNFKKQKNQ